MPAATSGTEVVKNRETFTPEGAALSYASVRRVSDRTLVLVLAVKLRGA